MSDEPQQGDDAPLAPAVQVSPSDPALARFARAIEPYEVLLAAAAALALFLPLMWTYTLIDPWETHYAEVARRMLEERDWVHLKWQNEIFRSKPVLSFWIMAASMQALGVAEGGGYSGEMASSGLVIFAVRLPFVLFAALGLTAVFWMLKRLVNRRVAWLGFLAIATTPFYFLVARQAITDMPMVACTMGAIACFAMAIESGDERLEPIWRRLSALHLFLAALVLFVGIQLLYFLVYFLANPSLAHGLRIPAPALALCLPIALGLAGFVVWSRYLQPTVTRRSVYMYWFYFFVGVSILAKGPPGVGVVGAVCFFYILVTWNWRLLPFKLEIPRGLLIAALVVVPWHVAMWLKDGRPWVNEYFNHHMFKRFGSGVHGDRGTFDYFASQIGVGMWPWAALIPAALALALLGATLKTREGRVKLLVGIWALAAFAVFALSQTKFHHYVLPAVPALALLCAFFLDDLWTGRARHVGLAALCGVAIVFLVCRDLMGEQKQIIELFIYRYDRPWPSGPPWNVDLSGTIGVFGILFAAAIAAFAVPMARRYAIGAFLLCAVGFTYWAANSYMGAAAPHWGQRELHRTYYRERQIHGVELKYFGLRDLARDFGEGGELRVRSVLPEGFAPGLPQRVTVHVPGIGLPEDRLVLAGEVSRLGANEFTIRVDRSGPGADTLADLIERGRRAGKPPRRRWLQVDADRLIAWQLNWRGENFWSSGEIYGQTEDTQTVFMHTDNKAFLEYLKAPGRAGRRYFVITEAGRAAGLRNVLPTQQAKDSYEVRDTSCNKFTLLSFTL